MLPIRTPIAIVQSICGDQRVIQGVHYRLSKHCVSVICEEGNLLYHTMTGSLLLLANGESRESAFEKLVKNWFLVPEGFNEQKHVDDMRRIVQMLQPKKHVKTDFTVLTTTDCNARCFYCYELGIRRFSMTEEMAENAARYIIAECNGNPVKLRWFGGEPLYNWQAIDTVCRILQDNGISFESSMVSNGYYLDKKTTEKACLSWHLKKVQITIDGTVEVYNRTKAYIDAEGNPYEKVMENIQTALQAGIYVTIRLNMDAGNAQDLLLLLDDIGGRFSGHENLDIYIALLQEFSGRIHRHGSESQAEQAYNDLRDKAEAMQLLRHKKLPAELTINRCMADNENSETILPDGRVGRCEHYSEAMITGDIWNNERDPVVLNNWKEPLSAPECAECVLYPQCQKLKLCEWNREGCNELDRRIKITELRNQVLSAYREYKEGVRK